MSCLRKYSDQKTLAKNEGANKTMAKLIFENISLKQAEAAAKWFEGQGEQDMTLWFDEMSCKSFIVDVDKKDWIKIDEENQIVTVKCK